MQYSFPWHLMTEFYLFIVSIYRNYIVWCLKIHFLEFIDFKTWPCWLMQSLSKPPVYTPAIVSVFLPPHSEKNYQKHSLTTHAGTTLLLKSLNLQSAELKSCCHQEKTPHKITTFNPLIESFAEPGPDNDVTLKGGGIRW